MENYRAKFKDKLQEQQIINSLGYGNLRSIILKLLHFNLSFFFLIFNI